MKIYRESASSDTPPAVIAVIEFDPWPFCESQVGTRLGWVDDYGAIMACTHTGEWCLEDDGDNMIAILEDGTQVIGRKHSIQKYMDIAGGVEL